MHFLFIINTLIKSTTLVFGFVISLVLTYFMGSKVLGFYVLYVTLVNLLLILVKFGQDRYLMIEISKGKLHSTSPLLTNSLFLIVVTSICAVIISSILQAFELVTMPEEIDTNLFLLFLFMSLLGGGGMAVLIATLRGNNKVTTANFFESVPLNFILLVVIIVFGVLNDSENHLTLIVFFHGIISLIIALILMIRLREYIFSRANISKFKFQKHFRRGLPFAIITGATVMNTSIDTLNINYFLTLEDIAHYNVALKLSSLVQFGLIIGTSIVAHKFTMLFEQKKVVELKATLISVIKISSVMAISVFTFLFIFSSEILSLWGSQFNLALPALLILSAAQLINVFFGPMGVLLTMIGKERSVLFGTLSSLVINFILTVQLTPMFGIHGAAIATAFAIMLQNGIFFWLIKRYRIFEV